MISKYIIGLMIVATISILPETLISINAVLNGTPEFGLAMLFGSNITDLTLVFGIILLFSGRKEITIESKILKNNTIYPYFFLAPVILWFDGAYSRLEGIALMVIGTIFYYYAFKNVGNEVSVGPTTQRSKKEIRMNVLYLVIALAVLLVSAHFTVTSATALASSLGVPLVLIGILIVGVGTTIPEMLFSFNAVKKYNDELAVGDLLGTVLADATIVVGIIALIQPFEFPQKVIFTTAIFMVCVAFLLTYFMRTGKAISQKEGMVLIIIWVIFVCIEYLVNTS